MNQTQTQIQKHQQPSKQKGITFIEVLIALVIIVTGILGSVAMQGTAKQGSFDAMQRSLASSLAQDMISRMRANSPANMAFYALDDYGVIFDVINDEPALRCEDPDVVCDPQQLITNDIYEWELALVGGNVRSNDTNRGGLVNGRGCVYQNGNEITVVVSWQGRNEMTDNMKVVGCGIAGDRRRQVILQAFII